MDQMNDRPSEVNFHAEYSRQLADYFTKDAFYTRQDPFETGMKLVRISLAFIPGT